MPEIEEKLSAGDKDEATEMISPHGDSSATSNDSDATSDSSSDTSDDESAKLPRGKQGNLPNPWKWLFQENRNLAHGLKLKKCEREEVVHLSESDVLDTRTIWKATLIGYVVGKPTDAKDIEALRSTWKISFEYMKHPSGWIVFKFDSEEHKQWILANGPYSSSGFPWIMKDIPPYFSFNDESFNHIPVWVTFPGLPMECWSDSALSKITSQVGDPITTDRCTALQLRVSFARVLVEIDARKELVRNVPIKMPNGEVHDQSVLYEFEPKLCATCNRVGHSTSNCRSIKKPRGTRGQRDNQAYTAMAWNKPSARPTLFGTLLKPLATGSSCEMEDGTSFGPSPSEAYPKKAATVAKVNVAKGNASKGHAANAVKGTAENAPITAKKIAAKAPTAAKEIAANAPTAPKKIAENAPNAAKKIATNAPTAAKDIAANAPLAPQENATIAPTDAKEIAAYVPTVVMEIAAIVPTAAKENVPTTQNRFESIGTVGEIRQESIQPTPTISKDKQKIDFSGLQDDDANEKQMSLYPKDKVQRAASTSKKNKKTKN